MAKLIYAILFIVILGPSLGACNEEEENSIPSEEKPRPEPLPDQFQYVFKENLNGYEVFRIPAIVKTKTGALLAFAEGRKLRSNGDSGDIDMVVRRSDNDGKTWQDLVLIWDDGGNTCGNPVPIVDYNNGRIHLLMTWNDGRDKWSTLVNGTGFNTRRPYYTYSDDEGLTWSTPKELTNEIKDPNWDWYGTGPVHGIQIQKGAFKGRLVSPNYYTIRANGKQQQYSHIAYSDDNGITWESGDPTPTDKVGECTIAELPDGSLMLNMRPSEGFLRFYAVSTDGGEKWSEPVKDPDQLDPSCQGSILNSSSAIFLSNDNSTERINMTVKMSTDNGENWIKQYLVHDGPSGYSDLVMISADKIAILYEGGINRYSEGITFEVIALSKFQ